MDQSNIRVLCRTMEGFIVEERFRSSASLNCKEPIIFHYTTAAGALGILSTGMLWCSLASHMNDKQECRYAHQVALERAHIALAKSSDMQRTRFLEEFKAQLDRFSRVKIYVACFSEAEDLLSQWRGYAGLGGYSIGFSLEDLRKLSKTQAFSVSSVKYDHQGHASELDPIISDLLARYDPNLKPSTDRTKIDEIFRPSMREIAEKSAIIKHPSFAEEREWRLHSQPFSNSYDRNEFIVRDNRIVPILKFKLENGMKTTIGTGMTLRNLSIRTFKVGPGADQEERQEALSAVIQRNKIYWHLSSRSNVPLR